jgi:hypothetical protein
MYHDLDILIFLKREIKEVLHEKESLES